MKKLICMDCENYKSSVYIAMDDKTLYTSHCSENCDVFVVQEKYSCEKFIPKKE